MDDTMDRSIRMKHRLALVVGIMLLAVPAFAGDVDGKWSRQRRHADGHRPGRDSRSSPMAPP
jgi:hypothetical protein